MAFWDDIFGAHSQWDTIFSDVTEAPLVQPVDQSRVVSSPSKAQLMLQPFLDQGLNTEQAIKAATAAKENRVNNIFLQLTQAHGCL